MVKIGFIGAGSIARAHILASIAAGFIPTAICGKNLSDRAKALSMEIPGLKHFKNVDELLKSDLDCISILLNSDVSLWNTLIKPIFVLVLFSHGITTLNIPSMLSTGIFPVSD